MRIVYLSWPASQITGGIKMTYRHVEALVANGVDATIATDDGLPPTWFATSARTIQWDQAFSADVLVFPENYRDSFERFRSSPARKVVLCQNQYMAHRGLGKALCYSDYGATHLIAVGRQTLPFCQHRFPKLHSVLIPVFIDTEIFAVCERKHLQIAYSPSKRPLEATFIHDLFQHENPEFNDVPWIPLFGLSESDVAEILKHSAVYLSLCRFEACPLSVLEAFACGCVVGGSTGFGARDYTTTSNGFWAAEDDCFDCCAQLTRAVRLAATADASYLDIVNTAMSDAKRYSRRRYEAKLLDFWKDFVGST
jgi:hypothetical protein